MCLMQIRTRRWLDEQLAGVTRQLHALRQAQGATQGTRQAGESQTQQPGPSGDSDAPVQQLQSRLETVAGCVGRLAESLGLEALLLPLSCGGVGVRGGSAGWAAAGSQGGRRNGRGKQAHGRRETAAACGGEDGASSGGEAAGGEAPPVASAESSVASRDQQEEQEQKPEDEGQAGQVLNSPEGSSTSSETAPAEQHPPLPRVDLPALLCRLDQLEAAVGAATSGQQALAAAAATAAAATGGAAVGGGGGGVLGAAAVQGLVDAAVSDLQLRLRQVERELPLVARSYEVRALTRTFVQLAAALGPGMGGGVDGLVGTGGGRNRANGNAHRAAGVDAELAKRLGRSACEHGVCLRRAELYAEQYNSYTSRSAGARCGTMVSPLVHLDRTSTGYWDR